METQSFLEWMVEAFMNDGFGVEMKSSNDDGIVFSVILPVYPFHQVSRFFPFDCRPSEAALIYWDLSNSIRRKERYAESRHKRMAT